jgi:hypothetical protein
MIVKCVFKVVLMLRYLARGFNVFFFLQIKLFYVFFLLNVSYHFIIKNF